MLIRSCGLLTAVAAFGLVASAASAQSLAGMEALRQQIDGNKQQIVASNLRLSGSEAADFWPVYEAHQAGLAALDERTRKLVQEYTEALDAGQISDRRARSLIDEAIAIDAEEVELRKALAAKLDSLIPAMEAARYLQMESKIRAIVRFELASQIPLAQ